MNVRAGNVGVNGFQTDSRRWHRLAFISSTWALAHVVIVCSFIGDSAGSVIELICPSNTIFRAIRWFLSRLPAARWGSPSSLHAASPCVGRVAVEETILREPKWLCSRSSTCAVSPGASASSTGVGTICLCVTSIG